MNFFDKKATKKKILIVEDDKILLEMYLDRFKKERFDVFYAENGEEALKIITTNKVDLILLDLLMPKKGGLGVIQVLKSNPEHKNIPIIVMTAYPQENYKKMALENGVVDFISKSEVMPAEIVEKVKKIINNDTHN